MSMNRIKLYSLQYNKLTTKFFSEYVLANKKNNVVISPLSIIVLLAIAADATDGRTRDEIAGVLKGALPYDAAMGIISMIQREFTETGSLISSNAAIVNKMMEKSINPEYKEKIASKFGGELFCTDDVVDAVDSWVKEKTNGMIDQIADGGMADMLLVLINAVYFEEKWEEEYKEHNIKEDEFTNADGSKSVVNMMFSREHSYIENEFFTGFLKTYKNGDYSFMALLPKAKFKGRRIRRAVEKIDFTKLYDSASHGLVLVDMPEFKVEFKTTLTKLLIGMGIKRIFSAKADFSQLSNECLKAESIIHKARIEVDRNGTKAAAVTSFALAGGRAPGVDKPKIVRLDRPFIYAIMHNETGLPIFTGITNRI